MDSSQYQFLDNSYDISNRIVNPIQCTVTYDGIVKHIRRKELELLAILAANNRRLVPRNKFIDIIWQGNMMTGDQGLTRAIASLRASISDNDKANPIIRTIPRQGYQLNSTLKMLQPKQVVSFNSGDVISSRPNWQLLKPILRDTHSETWLAGSSSNNEFRSFKFCFVDKHLSFLKNEVLVSKHLMESGVDQSHFLDLLNWQLNEPPYYIETTYARYGNLIMWSEYEGGLSEVPLSERMRLMGETAKSLHYLHAVNLVHQNLSAECIMIDDVNGTTRAKLGGVEQCKVIGNINSALSELKSKSQNGNHNTTTLEKHLIAPEVADGQPTTQQSDIFALGVLLFQVSTNQLNRPIAALHEFTDLPDDLMNLISHCISHNPENRPTAEEISVSIAEVFADEYQNSTASNLNENSLSTPLKKVGPYKVLETLGEGGMGTVYLAKQNAPVERLVALKLVKLGLNSDMVLARFEVERQALAMMNHVNVATVFDAGRNDSHHPYFVMEYVPGKSIIEYSDDNLLSIKARLKLFIQVCDGLSHAHQKGVIHRDINPSNILVKSQQSLSPVVKVIDFGVAKSLQNKLSTKSMHTALGSFVGTPQYTSPEQIEGLKGAVDTRSDIYSLGMVLYELLSGVTPFKMQELTDMSHIELLKMVSLNTAHSPHHSYDSLDEKSQNLVANQRSSSIEKLKKQLKNEASWIVLKCIEINPDDRYESVTELKKDLIKWLNDEPITARKPNAIYRLSKYIKRHRFGFVLSLLSMLTLVGTTSTAIWGYLKSSQFAEIALNAANEANLAADFQINQLQSISPTEMGLGIKNEILQAIQHGDMLETNSDFVLDQLHAINFTDLQLQQLYEYYFKPALRTIREGYQDYPFLQGKLWHSNAETLEKLGLWKEAIEPAELALQVRQQQLGEDHVDTLTSMVLYGRILFVNGKLSESEQILSFAKNRLIETRGIKDSTSLMALRYYPAVLEVQDNITEAKKVLERIIPLHKEVFGERHPNTIKVYSNYAIVLAKENKLVAAEQYFKKSMDGHIKTFGKTHTDTLVTVDNYCQILMKMERHEEALSTCKQNLQMRRVIQGDDHPRTDQSKLNYARALNNLGKQQESVTILLEALDSMTAKLGRYHKRPLFTMNVLADTYHKLGNNEQAKLYILKSIEYGTEALGERNSHTFNAKKIAAKIHKALGEDEVALAYHNEILTKYNKRYGKDHPRTIEWVKAYHNVQSKQ